MQTGDAFTTCTTMLLYYNSFASNGKERCMISLFIFQGIYLLVNLNHYGSIPFGILGEMAQQMNCLYRLFDGWD